MQIRSGFRINALRNAGMTPGKPGSGKETRQRHKKRGQASGPAPRFFSERRRASKSRLLLILLFQICFDRGEGFRTQIMLDPAGVVHSGLLIDPELHKPL